MLDCLKVKLVGLCRVATVYAGASAELVSTSLPAPAFPGFPGWLGFATVNRQSKSSHYFWSPSSVGAQAVLFSRDWRTVESGTKLIGVSAAGREQLTFIRSRNELYGCDQNQAEMASFKAEHSLPEGPVWVLPVAEARSATAVAVKELPVSALASSLKTPGGMKLRNARSWKVGPVTLVLEKTGGLNARLTAYVGGRANATKTYAKYFMEGADKGPLDLFNFGEVGMPLPVGAFRLKPRAGPVIVFWLPGYEGVGFELLQVENGKGKFIEGGSLYFCAF